MVADVSRDTGYAPTRWDFDEEITRVFDNMLARSIPDYMTMRDAVTRIALATAKHGTTILDIGCSRGEAIAPLIQRQGAWNRYIGLEISPPMIDAARERFATWIEHKIVEIRAHDLRSGLPLTPPVSVILSVLTTMFVPVEHRQHLLSDCYRALSDDGALIFVEKLLGASAQTNDLFVREYYAFKAENGYTTEDIERKRLALEGVLVPLSEHANLDMIGEAGFERVECFWRWMNFAGFVAFKRKR